MKILLTAFDPFGGEPINPAANPNGAQAPVTTDGSAPAAVPAGEQGN